jgi:hypothetical protein
MHKNLAELRKIVLSNDKIDSALSIPRSLEINNNNTILLGTLGSEIYELEFEGSFLNGNFKANNIYPLISQLQMLKLMISTVLPTGLVKIYF